MEITLSSCPEKMRPTRNLTRFDIGLIAVRWMMAAIVCGRYLSRPM